MLHEFFLECGARANEIRVNEMVDDPTARAMVGFLLVRGGVHIVADSEPQLTAPLGPDIEGEMVREVRRTRRQSR